MHWRMNSSTLFPSNKSHLDHEYFVSFISTPAILVLDIAFLAATNLKNRDKSIE